MATEIIQFDYRYAVVDSDPGTAAATLCNLRESGVNLIGFSEFPRGKGRSQLDLIAEDTEELERTATDMGLQLSAMKTGFLIQGDSRPSAVVPGILQRLADARIMVTSVQAVSAGAGRFGALLWVKPREVKAAAAVLGASVHAPVRDIVDETSEESFPASDAPAWAASRSA